MVSPVVVGGRMWYLVSTKLRSIRGSGRRFKLMKTIVGINFLSHTKANDKVQTLLEDTGNGRILVKVELGTKTCVEADLKWGSCSQCGEVIITDHRGRTLSLSGAAPPRALPPPPQ